MARFFAQLKTIFKSENEQNEPITATSRNTKQESAYGKIWVLGSLSLVMLLLLLTALAYGLKQTKQNKARIEIISRLQIHNQRLPIAAQQAFSGNENAFQKIKATQAAINQSIILLSQGGFFRQNKIEPVTHPLQLEHLEIIINNWRIEEDKIQHILKHQKTFINLGQAVDTVDSTSTEIIQKVEQLIHRMTQIGSATQELGAIITMRTLTQNIAQNIKITLSSRLSATQIKRQLTHDRKQFSIITQALNQEHNMLNFSNLTDPESLELLSQLQSLFIVIDDTINAILTEILTVAAAKAAAKQLIQNSEIMHNSIMVLDHAFQAYDIEEADLFKKVLYTLTACSALSLMLFAFSLHRHKPIPLQANTSELDKTQQTMLQLLDDMKKIADGDLTVRTNVTEDITGAIADAVNYTIEELHTLAEQVNEASDHVVKSSSQAQHVSTQLLAAAQQQSHKIEETTITVVNMAEAISKVSDTAAEATAVAQQSLATAEQGNIAVHKSIAGMDEIRTHIQDTSKRIKRLGESSQEISEIVTLVSDITEQTNVLALNAALQATAAGDAGRGFSVIAQDVQRLAERSTESSKQISRLVKMIQNDTYDAISAMEKSTLEVAKGTQQSYSAGKALKEIETVSKRLAQNVSKIYDTSHAQTQAANQVIENMEKILMIARQTTDGTRKTSASIKKMSGFVSELKASVSNFKV